MKLWKKNYELNKEIEEFTVGDDYLLDQKLVRHDCLASIAHAKMLGKIKVLSDEEVGKLVEGLNEIIKIDREGKFIIKKEDEDVHTAIESYLVNKYGNTGKKIHTARSRNDQILTALRLYEKDEIEIIKNLIVSLMEELIAKGNEFKSVNMPGYTHMQKAMPTTVKIWLDSFSSALDDDLILLEAIKKLIDQSPLGTAAGFGVPIFKIDREYTAKEMNFSKVLENPMYAQMSRGKLESTVVHLLSQIMYDLNKLSTDLILFNMKEFSYIHLPQEFCTGSSIMPQKKNPDVLELVRAKYHIVLGEEFKIKSLIGNLMSGYNRDLQLTKGPVMNSLEITKDSLEIMQSIISNIEIDKEKCKLAMTKELYATEEAYKLVKEGVPFRDAYKRISDKFKSNN